MNGSRRKDQLKALFGATPETIAPEAAVSTEPKQQAGHQAERDNAAVNDPAPSPHTQSAPASSAPASPAALTALSGMVRPAPMRSASGAVKAMGLSLGDMSREIENARRLSESLADAEKIIEIDPKLIDASFVEDRLTREDRDDPDFTVLMDSLRDHGQQVPILVRPHPEQNGRFQAAYGHRRMRAAARLGQAVKAIIRNLTDTELVLAQGKENSERRDLSFIERALFARSLIERGFERAMVQDALSLHKAEMTRFLQVASFVPENLIRAIGPAPKVGRPRWLAMAESLKAEGAINRAEALIDTAGFKQEDSDARFDLMLRLLSKPAEKTASGQVSQREIKTSDGRILARLSATDKQCRLDIIDSLAPGFAAYVADELPRLLQLFDKSGAAKEGN